MVVDTGNTSRLGDAYRSAFGRPYRRLRHHPVEGAAVDLAALDREEDRGRVGIAQHLLDVEPERVTQDFRHVGVARALAGAGEHQRRAARAARLCDRLGRRIRTHHQDEGVAGEARRRAEPGELARVELDAGIVGDQSDQCNVAAEQREGGAVLRRQRVEVVGRAQAAGARHVLHHDAGIAGNVAADMAREQTREAVIAAAGAVADDQVDLPAAVEIFNVVLRQRDRWRRHEQQGGDPHTPRRELVRLKAPQLGLLPLP